MPDQPPSNHSRGFLAEVRGWPSVTVHVHEAQGVAHVHVHDSGSVIADVGLQSSELRLRLPADALGALRQMYPVARTEGDVLIFDLEDDRGRTAALSALAQRAKVERLGWQTRVQSP